LRKNKGRFLKPCPGTKEYLCCQYYFLNIGLNCPFNCTYCILQVYLNTNSLVFYVNFEDMLKELEFRLKEDTSIMRIGTGELTDSLALDPLVGLSPVLIEFFSKHERSYLELKTKSTNCEHLLGLDHRGKTIISWSLSPQIIIDKEEGLAPSLKSRLRAAKICQDSGYKIGIHFDPIILYEGWQDDYESIIEEIFKNLDHRSIPWISLGCFRFVPDLKGIIQERFPKSKIVYGEFVPCLDKKMRYPQRVRIHIYAKLISWIYKKAPNIFVYLCMESPEVWKGTFGFVPEKNEVLKSWLDERCLL